MVRNLLVVAAAAACVGVLSGCCFVNTIPQDPVAACAGDRCFIENEQFIIADRLYAKCGSILLLEKQLREELQWRNCEVNEAVYRLKKVHSLP